MNILASQITFHVLFYFEQKHSQRISRTYFSLILLTIKKFFLDLLNYFDYRHEYSRER